MELELFDFDFNKRTIGTNISEFLNTIEGHSVGGTGLCHFYLTAKLTPEQENQLNTLNDKFRDRMQQHWPSSRGNIIDYKLIDNTPILTYSSISWWMYE